MAFKAENVNKIRIEPNISILTNRQVSFLVGHIQRKSPGQHLPISGSEHYDIIGTQLSFKALVNDE